MVGERWREGEREGGAPRGPILWISLFLCFREYALCVFVCLAAARGGGVCESECFGVLHRVRVGDLERDIERGERDSETERE